MENIKKGIKKKDGIKKSQNKNFIIQYDPAIRDVYPKMKVRVSNNKVITNIVIAVPRTSLIRNLLLKLAGLFEASLASFTKDGIAKILKIII